MGDLPQISEAEFEVMNKALKLHLPKQILEEFEKRNQETIKA